MKGSGKYYQQDMGTDAHRYCLNAIKCHRNTEVLARAVIGPYPLPTEYQHPRLHNRI